MLENNEQEFLGQEPTDDFEQAFTEDETQPTEEAQTPEPQESEPHETSEPPEALEPVYSVKYNGKEMQLPLSELIANAQKGMNYDHVRGELEALRGDEALGFVEQLAAESGMTRAEYIDYVRTLRENEHIREEMQNGVPEHVARELNQYRKQMAQVAEAQAQERQAEMRREDYRRLVKEYPNLKEFPPEVVEAIHAGENPYVAYIRHENAALRRETAAEKTNRLNRSRAVGSLKESGGIASGDDFMDAWNSV